MQLTKETIEDLIDLANDKQLAELSIEDGEQKVVIKTAHGAAPVVAAPIHHVATAEHKAGDTVAKVTPPLPAAKKPENIYEVTSPMVGTFYRSPSPDSDPFVDPGTRVVKGQTVCIIEAMKLMNELESEVSGIVRSILVENGEPVEFGQVLMEIEV